MAVVSRFEGQHHFNFIVAEVVQECIPKDDSFFDVFIKRQKIFGVSGQDRPSALTRFFTSL